MENPGFDIPPRDQMDNGFAITPVVEACVPQKSVKLTGPATHFVSIRIEDDNQGPFGSPSSVLLHGRRVALKDPLISGTARIARQVPGNNLVCTKSGFT